MAQSRSLQANHADYANRANNASYADHAQYGVQGNSYSHQAQGRSRQAQPFSQQGYQAYSYASQTQGSSSMLPLDIQRKKKRGSCSKALLLVLLVLLLGGLLGFLLFNASRCVSGDPNAAGTGAKAPFVDSHDWSGLRSEGDRLYYYHEGDVLMSRLGVDVSQYQGWIDWNAVASDGIDFAIVRVGSRGSTEGDLYLDESFSANFEGARAAGLAVGVYFYSQAISEEEAREEAHFVLEQLQGASLDLPVVFDHEPNLEAAARANYLDGDTLTACARAFEQEITAAGYSIAVYGNNYDLARFNSDLLEDMPVWYAEYTLGSPSNSAPFRIWQYSSNGSVAGINAAVDMNLLLLS